MIKLLIGGSPCTHWSIAQKNNRETEPKGLGWELFKNYLIAKEKFKPDFFLYENNKSASQAIKDQIKKEMNVWDGTLLMEDTGARYIEINSALVSAQNRQRFYVHNCGEVGQPEDRGIILRDILESGYSFGAKGEKGYALTACYHKGDAPDRILDKHQRTMVAESIAVNPLKSGKSRTVTAGYANKGVKHILESNASPNPSKQTWDCVAEPVNVTEDGKAQVLKANYHKSSVANFFNGDGGMKFAATGVCEPIRIGDIGSTSQAHRVYSPDGKSVTLSANGGGQGGKTGLYTVPTPFSIESNNEPIWADWGRKNRPIYEVKNGFITIKGKQYPIKLADGFYIIRKLTPIECERLQTLPDNYTAAVSNTQRYKGLGNGWTAEVIIHILSGALKDVPRDEEIVVLSMYDGIGTGRYCLDKMGFTNVKYFAYEIDKYAKEVAMSNYPDIIQMGDAFDLRHPDWTIGY